MLRMRRVALLVALALGVLVALAAAASPRERRQAAGATQDYGACKNNTGVCVPYYLCKDGQVIKDGDGIIDIRVGGKTNSQECLSYLDVCCGPGAVLVSTTTTTTTTTTTQASATTTTAPYQAFCGKRNVNGIDVKIQGFKDNQAQYAEFPWMAAVLHKTYEEDVLVNLYVCGGSLIHPSIVLTAAHCVNKFKSLASHVRVRLGEWDTQRTYEPYPHQDRDVAAVVIHPGFHPGNLANDFALLYLAQPAVLGKNVGLICLEKINYLNSNTTCVVTGWGKDKFGAEGVFQNVLKTVNLPFVAHPACQNKLRTTRLSKYFMLHPSFLCAGGETGKDSCSGDGGSPLMCKSPETSSYVQAGIVAWGIGCGTGGVPGVYADVSFGYDWIVSESDKLLKNTDGYHPGYWEG